MISKPKKKSKKYRQALEGAEQGDYPEALDCIQSYLETSTVLIDSGDLPDALSTLERSLAIEPRQAILESIVQVVRYKMDTRKASMM